MHVHLQFIPNFYKFFRDSTDESALKELVNFFETLEKVIKLHGDNSYLGGVEKPGAADYLVWPWIERSQSLKTIQPGKQTTLIQKHHDFASFFLTKINNHLISTIKAQ